tara:strand:+ start:1585 stop:2046 length:462 start_codon:yes stop_codon:yes gene_type:complete
MTTTNVYGVETTPRLKADIINSTPQADIKGVLFPLFSKYPGRGIFSAVKGLDLFKSDIIQFIKTERGERVMLPNFGLSLRKFLFSPVDDDVIEAIASEIVYGLGRYLPNAVVRDLNVLANTDQVSAMGLPGIRVLLSVSPSNTANAVNISLDI